jgi:hypothetical protein
LRRRTRQLNESRPVPGGGGGGRGARREMTETPRRGDIRAEGEMR